MSASPEESILVLVGATATGKSAVGARLARLLDAEVVCLDSMQVYRGMDIGTGKPDPEERARAPHHLIDLVDPWDRMTVTRWLALAEEAIAAIRGRGRRVLFVGGTPLYLKALLHGVFEGPEADWGLRRHLAEEARVAGAEVLHLRLASVDPVAAARLHPNDVRRVVRALEVHEKTGRPISMFQNQWGGLPAREALLLGLERTREELHTRIDARVDAMFEAGLVAEVEGLLVRHGPFGREASQALGYREVLGHLEDGRGLAQTRALVKRNTRRFARRQGTWFRRFDVQWERVEGDEAADAVAERLLWVIKRDGRHGSPDPGRR